MELHHGVVERHVLDATAASVSDREMAEALARQLPAATQVHVAMDLAGLGGLVKPEGVLVRMAFAQASTVPPGLPAACERRNDEIGEHGQYTDRPERRE